jgi:hypothetical protein
LQVFFSVKSTVGPLVAHKVAQGFLDRLRLADAFLASLFDQSILNR